MQECCPPCSQIVTVNVPGTGGAAGAPGFTTTTASFVIPAIGATVNVSVGSTGFMTVGLNVFVGGANFVVTGINSITSVTLLYVGLHGTPEFPGDAAPGSNVPSGSTIVSGLGNFTTPLGVGDGGTGVSSLASLAAALNAQLNALLGGVPLPIGNGGTGAATVSAALTALGLGQAATSAYGSGAAYTLTTTPALLAFGTTSPTITIPATGTYLLLSGARIDAVAATFAANQTVTMKLRRTAAVAGDIANATASYEFDIITTKSYTGFRGMLPPVTFAATNADTIQLWGSVSVAPGAGSVQAVEAWLMALPIHLP